MITAPTGNFNLYKIGYNYPLGHNRLRVVFYYLNYKIGKELKTSLNQGNAITYSANLKYPIQNGNRALLISANCIRRCIMRQLDL